MHTLSNMNCHIGVEPEKMGRLRSDCAGVTGKRDLFKKDTVSKSPLGSGSKKENAQILLPMKSSVIKGPQHFRTNPWDLFEAIDDDLPLTAARDWINTQLNGKKRRLATVAVVSNSESVAEDVLYSTDNESMLAHTTTHSSSPFPPFVAPISLPSGGYATPVAQLTPDFPLGCFIAHPGVSCVPQLVEAMQDLAVLHGGAEVCRTCYDVQHHCSCLF